MAATNLTELFLKFIFAKQVIIKQKNKVLPKKDKIFKAFETVVDDCEGLMWI